MKELTATRIKKAALMGLPYLCNVIYLMAIWQGQMQGIFMLWTTWLYIFILPVATIGLAKYRYCRLLRFLCLNPLVFPLVVFISPQADNPFIRSLITLQTVVTLIWAFLVLRANTRR